MSSLPGPKGNPGYPGPPGIQVSICWLSTWPSYWLNPDQASLFFNQPLVFSIFITEIIIWFDRYGRYVVCKNKSSLDQGPFKKCGLFFYLSNPVSTEVFVGVLQQKQPSIQSYFCAVEINRVVEVNGLIKNCRFPIQGIWRIHL